MKKSRISVILVVILAFGFAQSASATSWYAGNRRIGAVYGVKALIWTPSSAPYLETSGESNWVSLPADYFVQAGWRYCTWYSTAQKYREYNTHAGVYDIDNYGTHAWNTSIEYKLVHRSGELWSIYIGGTLIGSYNYVRTAPTDGLAFSEVHESSDNVVDTNFYGVSRRSSSGTGSLFDQDNFDADSPYPVASLQVHRDSFLDLISGSPLRVEVIIQSASNVPG